MKANISRILLFFFLCFHVQSFAQMGINSTGTPPANNAMLDISSTTKGLLIPRMTTAQRTALAHTQGLTVFDITTNGYWYSDGSKWVNLATISSASPWLTSGSHIYNGNTSNVGIGTTTPQASFNVGADKTVLFGTDSSGNGNKLIWYGSKGAFRAGYAILSEFNSSNVGIKSFATGNGNTASGLYSIAMGSNNLASGEGSISMGTNSTSAGDFSFSLGVHTDASGKNSVALGSYTKASGGVSTAIGNANTASGLYSIAMGDNSIASGTESTAIGLFNIASGVASTAMGRFANTNNHTNSFCIAGVSNNGAATNTTDNQMMMRFDNYTFYVAGTNNYAYIIPASNGWAYTSDRNRKENFEELNGESVLKKIAKIPFYSWNFKDKEVKQYRHYGIMAQDFHDNFGKDNLGVIGNDTTVSALDLLGVAYSGIKALEKRTEELLTKNAELKLNNERLEAQVQLQNQKFSDEIAELKAMILPKKKKYALIRCKFDFEKKENRLSLK
jgi:hypothetical protein